MEGVFVSSGDNPFELIKDSIKILANHTGTFSHLENKKDKWIEGRCPKEMYPRLFSIETDTSCSVADRFVKEDNIWKFKGNWRRRLYSWEEEQVQDLSCTAGKLLESVRDEDTWAWNLSREGVYSAKSAYAELQNRNTKVIDNLEKNGIVWNKLVPAKIAAFSWKLLQDRIPTKSNLLKKGAFNPNFSLKCTACDTSDEDSNHIFFGCGSSKLLWQKISRWFDLGCTSVGVGLENLEDFISLFEERNKSVGNLIWQCTNWNIWIRRNSITFSGKSISVEEMFEKICITSFAWLKNRNSLSFGTTFFDWLREPISCVTF